MRSMYTKRFVIVDVEANGPAPNKGSMTEIGAVLLDAPPFNTTFHGRLRPIHHEYDPEAMKVCNYTWDQLETFDHPKEVMEAFDVWLAIVVQDHHGSARPIFVSDNPAWDFQWINYYFFEYLGRNPFGHSGRRIGDIYAGLVRDMRSPWKHLRRTKHTHNPVDDAKGNAEALWEMLNSWTML